MIGSIELFLMVQQSMELELVSYRDYYLLATDIEKTLLLAREHRPSPTEYLQTQYASYCNLLMTSPTDDLELKHITKLDGVLQHF
jgi:hypothetical protein